MLRSDGGESDGCTSGIAHWKRGAWTFCQCRRFDIIRCRTQSYNLQEEISIIPLNSLFHSALSPPHILSCPPPPNNNPGLISPSPVPRRSNIHQSLPSTFPNYQSHPKRIPSHPHSHPLHLCHSPLPAPPHTPPSIYMRKPPLTTPHPAPRPPKSAISNQTILSSDKSSHTACPSPDFDHGQHRGSTCRSRYIMFWSNT